MLLNLDQRELQMLIEQAEQGADISSSDETSESDLEDEDSESEGFASIGGTRKWRRRGAQI